MVIICSYIIGVLSVRSGTSAERHRAITVKEKHALRGVKSEYGSKYPVGKISWHTIISLNESIVEIERGKSIDTGRSVLA